MRLRCTSFIDHHDLNLFKDIGLITIEGLLKACSTQTGRRAVALKINVEEEKVASWVSCFDLMRVNGDGDYIYLLLEVGINNLSKLSRSCPQELNNKIAKLKNKNLFEELPPLEEVVCWITKAKHLDEIVYH